jgi:DNA polymerase elongation subunit (family B)
VALVDELPESAKPERAGDPPVIIYETFDQAKADVIRAKLEFYGIPTALSGDLALGKLYSAGVYLPTRILVPADQAEQARQILEMDNEHGR